MKKNGSRAAFLRSLIHEEIAPHLGVYDADSVLDELLTRGHVTEDELVTYGRAGFKRNVIEPAFKEVNGNGIALHPPTAEGKHTQLNLMDADNAIWWYGQKRKHIEDCESELVKLREFIIDRFGIDPE